MATVEEQGKPYIYITTSEYFSIGHRMFNPKFSDEENLKMFGECSNKNGHGHSYKAEITMKGLQGEDTAMLMDWYELKGKIQAVLGKLDKKHLEMEVEYFKDVVSTVENITLYVWNQMTTQLPSGTLFEVRLTDYSGTSTFYRGEKSH